MTGDDFLAAFMFGFITASVFFGFSITFVDTYPVEKPMVEKCLSVDSELHSYDSQTLNCVNGFSFSVHDLENN